MTALRRAGLFQGSKPVIVDLANSRERVRAMVEREGEAVRLEWAVGDQRIPLAWVPLTFGAAPLFAPNDGSRCTTLYLADGRFGARRTFGLVYQSQRLNPDQRAALRIEKATERLAGANGHKRVRGAHRARLLAELKANADRLDNAAWEQLDLAADRARLNRRRRPLKSDPAQSTRWALLRGRVSEPRFTSAEVVEQLRAPSSLPANAPHHAATGLPVLSAPARPKAAAPELDVRALVQRRGRARGFKLSWGSGPEGRVVLAALLGEGASKQLELEIWSAAGVGLARQQMAVVHGRRAGDVFLACSATGRRVLKLYLREDRFASAQAQRLR